CNWLLKVDTMVAISFWVSADCDRADGEIDTSGRLFTTTWVAPLATICCSTRAPSCAPARPILVTRVAALSLWYFRPAACAAAPAVAPIVAALAAAAVLPFRAAARIAAPM